jgi:hypothetical protein
LEFAAIGARSVGIDPETVTKARTLGDWPVWDALIRKELNQHEKMGT